jgi:hypothetical protein
MGLLEIFAESDLDKRMSEKITQFEGQIIGENEEFLLYAELLVLDEFKFLKFRILGPLSVEVFDGCKLFFRSDMGNLEIESDTLEIATDYSRKLKIGVTEFDIDLDVELINMVDNQNLVSLQIAIKKSNLQFKITDQKLLQTIINVEEE